MTPLYIIPSNVSVVRARTTYPNTVIHRKKYLNGRNESQNFITTVVNRMAMPEMPIDTNKNTEFKFMYDQFYRVILHYTNWSEESNNVIARRVKMAVPVLTLKDCEAIVRQTAKYGICIVCTAHQNKAILYKDALIQTGLNATLEEA